MILTIRQNRGQLRNFDYCRAGIVKFVSNESMKKSLEVTGMHNLLECHKYINVQIKF